MKVTILLAPSKTLDFTTPLPYELASTSPLFTEPAAQLASKLARLSIPRMSKLMSVSQPIATAVHGYYQDWSADASGRPALWTYKGDVYKGMKAQDLSLADADWAQAHLLIMSGLYGVVRPYDAIQCYRLEMKTRLPVGRKTNLNDFWGNRLAAAVLATKSDWLCNCCSDEYARVVLKHLPSETRVVTPVFMDRKPTGVIKVVPIYSKMMRGVIARWMITNRVQTPAELTAFSDHGYRYDASRSTPDQPVFYRPVMAPLRF